MRTVSKAARSGVTFPVEDIVAVTAKKPGMARGFVAVATVDSSVLPTGAVAAATAPNAVVLALGSWQDAHALVSSIETWLAGRPADDRMPEDPFAGINVANAKLRKHGQGLREHLTRGGKSSGARRRDVRDEAHGARTPSAAASSLRPSRASSSTASE